MTSVLNCRVPVGLTAALQDMGLSLAEIATTARLAPRLLEAHRITLSIADYFALWSAIRSVSGRPDIGLSLVKHVKADFTEPFFLAVLSAADMLGAFEIIATYKRILTTDVVTISADEAAREVTLTYVWPEVGAQPPQVLVDGELGFLVELARRATKRADLAPTRLELRTTALEEGAGHAAFFRCPIRLGAPENALVFASSDVARPFHTYNPDMLSALLPYLRANTPPAPSSVVARVRAVIAARLRGQRPTVRTVGKELAMSSRALQRALKDDATSFRQLLDEVRNEHARGYLSATSFSDAEVAFLVGFEDPNSFYRAFRSWNGMSPSEFRRSAPA